METHVPTPGTIKWARVILYIQAAATILYVSYVAYEIADLNAHGEEVAHYGMVVFLSVASVCLALAAVPCAIMLAAGRPRVRQAVIGIESLAILLAMLGLVSGAGTGPSLASIVVLVLMVHPKSAAWAASDLPDTF